MKKSYAKVVNLFLIFMLILGTTSNVKAASTVEWLVKPTLSYTYIHKFSEGLAIANIGGGRSFFTGAFSGGKNGYIDKTGKEVVKVIYTDAKDFSGGLAAVRKGEDQTSKWGFINTTGKEVIPLIYEDVKAFSYGLSWVKKAGKWGCIDITGKVINPFEAIDIADVSDRFIRVSIEGKDSWKTSLYDKKKKAYVIKSTDGMDDRFYEAFIRVYKGGKMGFMDESGKLIVPCVYTYAEEFSNGLAVVQDIKLNHGYVDKKGKLVVPCTYQAAYGFSDEVAWVSIKYDASKNIGTYRLIDKTGKKVLPNDVMYSGVSKFNQGTAVVDTWSAKDQKFKSGLIDKKGKVVLPLIYDKITDFEGNNELGLRIIEVDNKKGYIDKNGNIILKPTYYSISYFSDKTIVGSSTDEQYSESNWNFYDAATGKLLQTLTMYGQWTNFSEGVVSVEINWKIYLLDSTGQHVLPIDNPESGFDWISEFSDGIAPAAQNGKWGIIKNPLLTP